MEIIPHYTEIVYSKGSHKKVRWNCLDCGLEQIKTYKQALKTARCKKCSNTITNRAKDFKGEKNPFYGKTHPPGFGVGEKNAMWKGGPEMYKGTCADCGVQTSDRRGKYCKKCVQLGDRNHLWNPTYTEEERETKRLNPKYLEWAKLVKAKDNYTCQLCGVGKDLHSHHLNGFNRFPEERYIVDNGITLCKVCHNDFHDQFGRGNNTVKQFNDFKKSCKQLISKPKPYPAPKVPSPVPNTSCIKSSRTTFKLNT